MRKNLLIALTSLLLLPRIIYAQSNIEIINFPEKVGSGKELRLSVEIAASPNSAYYLKVRLGSAQNSLRNALTYSESTKSWLTDTSSWPKFPTVTTDQGGFWDGDIKAKTNSNVAIGTNLVLVRLRQVGTSKNLDSPAQEIEIIANNQTQETPATPLTTNNSLKVILNEFSPAPNEGKEWVEIYNPNSQTADLTGWKIDDIDGGSSPFSIPAGTKIKAKGFFVIFFSNKLNNTGDTVRIINSTGAVLEKYSYGKIDKGVIFAKDSNGFWKVTTTKTPGKKNIITSPPTEESASSRFSEKDSRVNPLNFVSPESTGLADFPEILGIENPPTFDTTIPDKQEGQSRFAGSKSKTNKNSFSIILIGLGLILLGLAVGFPVLKGQEINKQKTKP